MARHRLTYALLVAVILPIVMLIGTLLTSRNASAATPTPAPTSEHTHPYKLAYQATDGELSHIYVANADASNPVAVSGMSVNAYDPVWSPNGKQIAFIAGNRTEQTRLYVMNANGTMLHSLKYYPDGLGPVSWSPDGTRLAVGSEDIDILDLQGKVLFHLAGTPNYLFFGTPAWSPNGKWIAYSQRFPAEKRTVLFLMDGDGTHRRELTSTPYNYNDIVVWSPDSQQIAYVIWKQPSYRSHIYLINVDGSHEHELVPQAIEDDFPAWSPDGKQIAFLGWTTANTLGASCCSPHDLHVINVDGTADRLVEHVAGNDHGGMVAWSPDGQYLAYQFKTSDMGASPVSAAHVVNLDGTGDLTLLNVGTRFPSSSWASWQPLPH
jgi:TolB protein